jgi:hypothetical protein
MHLRDEVSNMIYQKHTIQCLGIPKIHTNGNVTIMNLEIYLESRLKGVARAPVQI